MKTTTGPKRDGSRTQSKLSELLAKHGIRYTWEGNWPTIPRALRWDEPDLRLVPATQRVLSRELTQEQQKVMKKLERYDQKIVRARVEGRFSKAERMSKMRERLRSKTFDVPFRFTEITMDVPPDAPPAWVAKIRERIFEIVLPLKKSMSLEFYDAAIFGYYFSASSRELAGRLAESENMPRGDDKKRHEEVAIELVRLCKPTFKLCREKKAETVVTFKGFEYGIKCQRREASWTYSTRHSKAAKLTTETAQVYEALLRNWHHVDDLTHRHATSREIGAFIAGQITISNGMSFADYFAKNPDTKEVFLKTFQTICARLGIPLPPRGRPPPAKPATA
jgi:hypothetical protein